MLFQYDLYDLYAVFTEIRHDIQYKYNINILDTLIDILKYDEPMEDNMIRKAVSAISELDNERWSFVYYNNLYVYHKRITLPYINKLLYSICLSLKEALSDENFEMAYDIADCIHCLPLIMVDKKDKELKKLIKERIKYYQKKWNNDFLLAVQEIINN